MRASADPDRGRGRRERASAEYTSVSVYSGDVTGYDLLAVFIVCDGEVMLRDQSMVNKPDQLWDINRIRVDIRFHQ